MDWKRIESSVVDSNEVKSLKALRSSQIDTYNNRKGDVDIADREEVSTEWRNGLGMECGSDLLF